MIYNLIEEPWIPLLNGDGVITEVSLREALINGHMYSGVQDPIPTVEFGLYRLLVTFAHAITGISGQIELAQLVDRRQLPTDKIEAYLEKWKDRFNLFDEKYPFLQTVMTGEKKPLAGLVPMVPSGTNSNHFHRSKEDEFAVSPGSAARLLTTIAPFMNAGGAGLSPSINGAPPYYALIVGNNLFETVALNLCAAPPTYAGSKNTPVWEGDGTFCKGEVTEAPGLVGAYTWQPRRLRLIAGSGGNCSLTNQPATILISSMYFEAGAATRFKWQDPNVAYVNTEKGETPLRPQEGREIWRQTGPLALLTERSYRGNDKQVKVRFERPLIVSQFANLAANDYIDQQQIKVRVYGMRTDNAKVLEWQAETLILPKPLLVDDNFHLLIQHEMDKAGEIATAIRNAIHAAFKRGGKGAKNPYGALVEYSQRRFWQDLKPAFDQFLLDLSTTTEELEPLQRVTSAWRIRAKQIGEAAVNEAIGALDTNSDALRRSTVALHQFSIKLRSMYAVPEQGTSPAKRTKKDPATA